VTSQETVAKYLSEGKGIVSCARSLVVTKLMGEGLRTFGFSLDVRIGNDAPTFHAVNLAGIVFLFRNEIGDQATVCTGRGRTHWESLWGSS